MKVKILSWNIWRSKNIDDAIEFLKKSRPDITYLQEAVKKNGEDTTAKIARALGYHYIWHKAFTTNRHIPSYDLGNAILSKFPILENSFVFLSDLSLYKNNAETEPRIAQIAKVQTAPKTNLHIINTHLAYSTNCRPSKLRSYQIENLLKLIEAIKPNSASTESNSANVSQTVVAGDFNTTVESGELGEISKILVNADQNPIKPTWPLFDKKNNSKTQPKYRIDHIFTSADIKVEKFKVEQSSVSDHLPISAVLAV